MVQTLTKLMDVHDLAIVGGSDLSKIKEQVGEKILNSANYVFSENGMYNLKKGEFFSKMSIKDKLGEPLLNKFINFCLSYLSKIDIPVKRGTFIEYRMGMLNISPIGRNCSQQEREEFEVYDKEHKIRENFVEALKTEFAGSDLKFSIGGQISFDVFPIGWDKTFCLQFVEEEYGDIHFFGDKTFPVY